MHKNIFMLRKVQLTGTNLRTEIKKEDEERWNLVGPNRTHAEKEALPFVDLIGDAELLATPPTKRWIIEQRAATSKERLSSAGRTVSRSENVPHATAQFLLFFKGECLHRK